MHGRSIASYSARADLTDRWPALAAVSPSRFVRRCRIGLLLVARGGKRSGIAGVNPARVGDTPISSNESGLGVTFLFLLEAPVLTAFNPKKRCPFQFVPVIALATCERLR